MKMYKEYNIISIFGLVTKNIKYINSNKSVN